MEALRQIASSGGRKILRTSLSTVALGAAALAVPLMASQERSANYSGGAARSVDADPVVVADNFDQSLAPVTAQLVIRSDGPGAAASQTSIGGQGWHLIYAVKN